MTDPRYVAVSADGFVVQAQGADPKAAAKPAAVIRFGDDAPIDLGERFGISYALDPDVAFVDHMQAHVVVFVAERANKTEGQPDEAFMLTRAGVFTGLGPTGGRNAVRILPSGDVYVMDADGRGYRILRTEPGTVDSFVDLPGDEGTSQGFSSIDADGVPVLQDSRLREPRHGRLACNVSEEGGFTVYQDGALPLILVDTPDGQTLIAHYGETQTAPRVRALAKGGAVVFGFPGYVTDLSERDDLVPFDPAAHEEAFEVARYGEPKFIGAFHVSSRRADYGSHAAEGANCEVIVDGDGASDQVVKGRAAIVSVKVLQSANCPSNVIAVFAHGIAGFDEIRRAADAKGLPVICYTDDDTFEEEFRGKMRPGDAAAVMAFPLTPDETPEALFARVEAEASRVERWGYPVIIVPAWFTPTRVLEKRVLTRGEILAFLPVYDRLVRRFDGMLAFAWGRAKDRPELGGGLVAYGLEQQFAAFGAASPGLPMLPRRHTGETMAPAVTIASYGPTDGSVPLVVRATAEIARAEAFATIEWLSRRAGAKSWQTAAVQSVAQATAAPFSFRFEQPGEYEIGLRGVGPNVRNETGRQRLVVARPMTNRRVALVANNGRALRSLGVQLRADGAVTDASAAVELLDMGGGEVAIRMVESGRLVRAEFGGGGAVKLYETEANAHERFKLLRTPDGKTAFQTASAFLLCSENGDGFVTAARRNLGAWESFDVVDL